MDCSKIYIRALMQEDHVFKIPCFQRSYAWNDDPQCRVLYEDIERIAAKHQDPEDKTTHFLGSLVVQPQDEEGSRLLVIDGQQRLTSMYLLYLALTRVAQQRGLNELVEEISSILVRNQSSKLPPFSFPSDDQLAFAKLYDGDPVWFKQESALTKNYLYFCQRLSELDDQQLRAFYEATQYLELVKMSLEYGDDSQLIFESLNSKGLPLSLWDKVRNFVLMNLSADDDEYCYKNYWQQIELFVVPWHRGNFVRYYLEVKQGKVPRGELYYEFKNFSQASKLSNIQILQDMLKYAEIFSWIERCTFVCDDGAMRDQVINALIRLRCTGYWDWLPFGMQCLMRYRSKEISVHELLDALGLVETFIFRRWVCSIERTGFESFFASLAQKIDNLEDDKAGADFVSKLKWILCSDSAKMPTDADLKGPFCEWGLNYKRSPHTSMRNYIIASLEAGAAREANEKTVSIFPELKDYTNLYSYEHIMPQNLTDEWKADLGSEAKDIHRQWVHRIGNLTLVTRSENSALGDRPFNEKRSIDHGYAHSGLYLNRELAKHDKWGVAELEQRTNELYQLALRVWPYPMSVCEVEASEMHDSSEHFDYCLADGERDLTWTQPLGFEFMGEHHDVDSWVDIQRLVVPQIYRADPKRLREWLGQTKLEDAWVKQFFTKDPEFMAFKHTPQGKVDLDLEDNLFFNAKQPTNDKIKVFKQLFAAMGIEPQQLVIHLKDKESVANQEAAEAMAEAENEL